VLRSLTISEVSVPTYSYACTECGNRFDAVQAFSDDALTTCPKCSGRLRKLFSSVGVVFKGSGFYRTDSRSGSGNGTSDGASKDGKADGKTAERVGANGSASQKSGDQANANGTARATSGNRSSGGNGYRRHPDKVAAGSSSSTGGSGSD
jgi:putative FmdB family regulatory protein